MLQWIFCISTASLGYQQPDELNETLATVMGKIMADEAISTQEGFLHHEEGVDLLPGNTELSGMEVSLVNAMSRETILNMITYDDTGQKADSRHKNILERITNGSRFG